MKTDRGRVKKKWLWRLSKKTELKCRPREAELFVRMHAQEVMLRNYDKVSGGLQITHEVEDMI